MITRPCIAAIASTLALIASGCYLPIPHTELESYGTTGTVINRDTKKPIEGAIIAKCHGSYSTSTDRNGFFEIPAMHKWKFWMKITPSWSSQQYIKDSLDELKHPSISLTIEDRVEYYQVTDSDDVKFISSKYRVIRATRKGDSFVDAQITTPPSC